MRNELTADNEIISKLIAIPFHSDCLVIQDGDETSRRLICRLVEVEEGV